MQSDRLKSLRVAINGGSIGGLCASVPSAGTAHRLIFTIRTDCVTHGDAWIGEWADSSIR